ncbi:MAG TPA: hypothetical protein VFL82_05385 [Thermomicrobiales bacterium]|nr:hypothetical protein [Thermomicrobiales bacterium]
MAQRVIEANQFDLTGDGGVQIHYDSTSIDGTPKFSYRGPGMADGQAIDQSFSGDDIYSRVSEIGQLVTVTLHVNPDGDTLLLSLVVPDFNLTGKEQGAGCQTYAFLTTNRGGLAPGAITGQLQNYRLLQLGGTARHVES